MNGRVRRKVLSGAGEVPADLVEEVIVDMSGRLVGSPEARRCAGLSFAFELSDVAVRVAVYEVGEGGRVRLRRTGTGRTTFHFRGGAAAFDDVLRGRSNALAALVTRQISMRGSLLHLRGLLQMMPAVTRAYTEARASMVERYAGDYDFRF